jgi:hypothetical protein
MHGVNWGIPSLVRALRHEEDFELRRNAADALCRIGTSQARYAARTSRAVLTGDPMEVYSLHLSLFFCELSTFPSAGDEMYIWLPPAYPLSAVQE